MIRLFKNKLISKSFIELQIRKMSNSKKVLVFLATGAEEMEVCITVDVLRRGGFDVKLAGVNGADPVVCSRNVRILPDIDLESVKNDVFDAVIVPGGLKGAEICSNDVNVGEILSKHYTEKKLVAAICAGPTAFINHKIAFGKKLTSYPSFKDKLSNNFIYSDDRVVQDENLITSQGPGTTFEFALKIIEYFEGKDKMLSVMEPMRVKI